MPVNFDFLSLERRMPSKRMSMALLLRFLADLMAEDDENDERGSIEKESPEGAVRTRPDFIPLGG